MQARRTQLKICIGVIACVLMHASIADSTVAAMKELKRVRLGYRENSAPFSFLDSNKRPNGYTVELCQKIVQDIKASLKLNAIELEWVLVTGAERVPAIRDGKIDLECGNTTNTPDRRRDVAFAIPTFIDGLALLSPADAPLKDVSQLRSKRVAVGAASPSLRKLTELNQKYAAEVAIVEVSDNARAMQLLEEGRVDAWMTDQTVLRMFKATAKAPSRWHVSTKRFSVEPLAIMLRKDDAEFATLVNESIRNTMYSGSLTTLYKRWFTQTMPDRGVNLELPMSELLHGYVTHPTPQLPDNF
jgi:ABC-type amino acid transport substrate-binding protein